MLLEVHVRDLGTIAEARLVLGPGMTALTGETGAGKTLLVGAIELLVGGRADPSLVRADATEAVVEGRAVIDGQERVLTRVVPRDGRSRAYVDGRLATVATLGELGSVLVDLHGQHAHQSLLAPAVQRAALDRFAGIAGEPLAAARARVRDLEAELGRLGGDERARAREIDLLRHEIAELAERGPTDADEDDRLAAEELVLGDALAHQESAALAVASLLDDGGALDRLGTARAALGERAPFAELAGRLEALIAEVADVGREIRARGEAIEHDPERLAAVGERRRVLGDLRRRYGDTLAEVLAYADEVADRLAELEDHDARAVRLDADRAAAASSLARVEAEVRTARTAAAPQLAEAIRARLVELAMPAARIAVAVGAEGAGDDVAVLLAANPGSEPLPLARVASGGELARSMLALRLVLTSGPPCLVFDEVDAGIGGEAATAVGRALAAVATDHQVLVVTHLPQVAAYADTQVAVVKSDDGSTTVSDVVPLPPEDRASELSRMLSGRPGSAAARRHAEELLATAAAERSR